MKEKIFFLLMALSIALVNPAEADMVLPFRGEIDFSKKQLDLTLQDGREGSIAAKATRITDNKYQLFININHWQTAFFNLTSEVESSLELVEGAEGAAKKFFGRISSQYSLLDYKPIEGLNGEFEINDKRIMFNSLSFGNMDCIGHIDFSYPHKIDLLVGLKAMDLGEVVGLVSREDKENSEGAVTGQIKISGAMDRLELRGNLESFDGFVDELRFDSFFLNFDGVFPNIQLANTSVSQVDGLSFKVDGKIDLKELNNIKKQIGGLVVLPLVSNSDDQTEWTIKRLRNEGAGTTELNYFLKKGKDIGGPERLGHDMLGIEKKMEF